MPHIDTTLRRTVVVSGASAGIGRATAVRLAEQGWTVFAGVRRLSTAPVAAPSTPGTIEAVQLDVTDPVSVRDACRHITAALAGAPLTALVNNAGVGLMAPMQTVEIAELRSIWDVNVLGTVRLTQALLPYMTGGSRLVMVGSVGDRVTMPFGGPLTSSKWAIASIAEAFRLELHDRAIRVTLIEPGLIASDAPAKIEADAQRTTHRLALTDARLAEQFHRAVTTAIAHERNGSTPDTVARAISDTLDRPHPKTRVLVGKGAHLLAAAALLLPDRVFDRIRIRTFRADTRTVKAALTIAPPPPPPPARTTAKARVTSY